MANELSNEKVSVNMNPSVLASIDLLVDNGYYSNRSDFINQAVREALRERQSTVNRIVAKNERSMAGGSRWFVGVSGLTRGELEELSAAGEKVSFKGYGVLIIDADCPEEQLFSVVEDIRVRGRVYCTDNVKKHYKIK